MHARTTTEIETIIAGAAKLPLKDAAFALWRQRPRLNTLEGLPSEEEVRAFRAATPEQQAAKLRHDREHAQDGPTFARLKRAHPRAEDADIKAAIVAAVKFDDDCFRYFSKDPAIDYWQRCLFAVAQAQKRSPDYLDATYQAARNHVALAMK
jgi:hypothetical protein